MQRRTAIVAAATTLAASALATVITPAALAATNPTARVLKAELQTDGSVKTQVSLACPRGSSFELQVAVSQEFESNGGVYEAVAYSPAVTSTCTGRVQLSSTQTTSSDRAPFQRHFGRHVPAGVTGPTLGTVLLTVTAADGQSSQSYDFAGSVALR